MYNDDLYSPRLFISKVLRRMHIKLLICTVSHIYQYCYRKLQISHEVLDKTLQYNKSIEN